MVDVNLIWILIISVLVFDAIAIFLMTFFVTLCCFLIKNKINELVTVTNYMADLMEERMGLREGTRNYDQGGQV